MNWKIVIIGNKSEKDKYAEYDTYNLKNKIKMNERNKTENRFRENTILVVINKEKGGGRGERYGE